MDEKALNVNLILSLLFQETQKYYDFLNKKQELRNELLSLESIINVFIDLDYKKALSNYNEVENLFKDKLNVSLNKINDYYFALYFLGNQEKGNVLNKEKIEYAKNIFDNILKKLKEIYVKYQQELENMVSEVSEEKFYSYKNVINDFKNRCQIGYNGYETIKELLKNKGYSEKDIVILLEKVKLNNTHITLKEKGGKLRVGEAYKIIDAVNFGFEEIQMPMSNNVNISKVESMISAFKSLCSNFYFNNAIPLLPEFDGIDGFTFGYNKEEFEYLMKSLLIYYQNQLLYSYKNLTNLETYEDKELRNLLVNEYYKNLSLYKNVREYMDNELDSYNIMCEEKVNSDEELVAGKELYYSLRNTDGTSTFFENDLKDISFDLYDGIKDLVVRFENNSLLSSKLRKLNEVFPGLKEIKNDQVRIVYRHMKDNKYVIVGVFQKKKDMDKKSLERMANRPIDNVIESKLVNEDLFARIDEKKQFGGRKNS